MGNINPSSSAADANAGAVKEGLSIHRRVEPALRGPRAVEAAADIDGQNRRFTLR